MKNSVVALVLVVLTLMACSRFGLSSSPTATWNAFVEASQKKDPAGIRKTLSKATVKSLEDFAKASNKSFDDVVKGEKVFPTSKYETRNEKIDGDKATLDIKNPIPDRDEWVQMPFVKEDGEWKLDLMNSKDVK